jgi:hypothetical protein
MLLISRIYDYPGRGWGLTKWRRLMGPGLMSDGDEKETSNNSIELKQSGSQIGFCVIF